MPDQAERPAYPPHGARSPPRVGGRDTVVAVRDGAVVQGLDRALWKRSVRRWDVPTIGTGLGSANFTHSAEDLR